MHLYDVKEFPVICGNFFNCKFPMEIVDKNELTINDAPNFFEIIRNSKWSEHTVQDFLIFCARLLFPASAISTWRVIGFLHGASRAGKSTLIDMVFLSSFSTYF